MASGKRMLVIGLDGATWDLLDAWATQGLLPTLQGLRDRGVWGPLRTTIPPITPSAWTSMYTGTNPGKHGIFGFSQRQRNGYRLSPVHASSRRTRTIFQILSDAGLKLGVLNAPATYPPEAVNGIFVPGIPVPEEAPNYTHPPEVAAELDALTGGKHKFPPALEQVTGDANEFLRTCDEYTRAVTSAALLLMERLGDWDFFMVQFQVTDAVQHAFWHHLDPQHPGHDPDAPESLRDAILDRYRTLDLCLGEILRQAGKDTNVIVASDHGEGAFLEQIYLNIWLWRLGWLKFRRRPTTLFKRLLYALGVTPEFLRRHIYTRMPREIRRSLDARKSGVLAVADRLFLSLDDVDWQRTRAYSYGGPYGAIYVNLEGREPQGCVSQEQYEFVLQELEQHLRQMRHPLTGEPLAEEILRSSHLYKGPFADQGPDLHLITRGYRYNIGFLQFQSKRWIGPPWNGWSGHHTMDGMILMSGPHCQAGAKLEGANVMDVAPTVLALLRQPVPDWMDGKVLAEGLDREFLKQNPPQAVHEEMAPSQAVEPIGYTAEEEAEISKRLADLGYIE